MELDLTCLDQANWPKTAAATNETSKQLIKWVGQLCLVVQGLREQINQTETENRTLKSEIETLKKNKQQNKNSPNFTFADLLKEKPEKSNEGQLVMLAKVSTELHNKKKIENNVIISGMPEAESNDLTTRENHDKTQIDKLLKELDSSLSIVNAKNVKRLTKKNKIPNSPPDLILIELDNNANQKLVVQNSKKLKQNENFKNVFINNDKTESERILESKLRAERNKRNSELTNEVEGSGGRQRFNIHNEKKYYWGIRSGELKWIQIKC